MIDIIIPMYNAQETIGRTLESILRQKMNEVVNIYLIDDFSNDSYSDVIEKYKNQLNIYYHRLDKKSGPGMARNYGLDISNGKYIVFIDADDMLEDKAIVTLYRAIEENQCDMVRSSIQEIGLNGNRIVKNWNISLHGKIYRRSFIDSNKIRFCNSFSNEDMAFNMMLRLFGARMINIEDITYRWFYNINSIYRKNPDESRIRDFNDITINTEKALYNAINHNCNKELIELISLEQIIQIYIRWIYMDKSKIDIRINKAIKDICNIYIRVKNNNIDDLIEKYNLIYNYDNYKKNELEKFIFKEKYSNYEGGKL